MLKLRMLVEALNADLGKQLSIQVVHNAAQEITRIEVDSDDTGLRNLDDGAILDSLFLIFNISALRLLIASDLNILPLWLDVLALNEIYISCSDDELDSLTEISEKLSEFGLRAGRLILGEPALDRDDIVIRFSYMRIGG